MAFDERVNILDGTGTTSATQVPILAAYTKRMQIESTMLHAGFIDHNRVSSYHTQTLPLARNQQTIIPASLIENPYGYQADKDRAAAKRTQRRPIDTQMNDAHIGRALDANVKAPFCDWYYSLTAGHQYVSVERLLDLNERLPEEIRQGFAFVPHQPYQRDAIHSDPYFPVALKDQGLLEVTVLPDNRSQVAKRYGRPFQDNLLALGLAAEMAAAWHFPNQSGPSDIACALGRYGALAGASFGIRHLLPTDKVWWYEPIANMMKLPSKGRVKVDHAISQTMHAIDDAITKPEWRAIEEEIDHEKQAFMTIVLPFDLSERPKWRTIVAEVDRYVSNKYPFVTLVWASGNGIPEPEFASLSPYHVNVVLFFPLLDLPMTFQRIIQSTPLIRRPKVSREMLARMDRQEVLAYYRSLYEQSETGQALVERSESIAQHQGNGQETTESVDVEVTKATKVIRSKYRKGEQR